MGVDGRIAPFGSVIVQICHDMQRQCQLTADTKQRLSSGWFAPEPRSNRTRLAKAAQRGDAGAYGVSEAFGIDHILYLPGLLYAKGDIVPFDVSMLT